MSEIIINNSNEDNISTEDNTNEDNNSQLEKENEIIEQIINNPLLLKDIDDLDEEDEDIYSEKDKIKENIIDNKLSFIVQDENENEDIENNNNNNSNNNNNNKKKTQKIQRDIIENLIIDLFEYHYKEISSEKKVYLGNKILQTKYHIQLFCTKLNNNFSKYILLILEQKIYELIEYVEEMMKTNLISVKDILEIKHSLKLTGRDIGKIFEKPFQKTMVFDISSVLILLFISDILSENKINVSDEEYEQLIQDLSYEEKDRFEKYIEDCKSFFEKIENGENEGDVEIYYAEDKQNENDILTNESTDIYNNSEEQEECEKEINEDKKENIEDKINKENYENIDNKENEIKINEDKKDIFIIEDIIDKNNNNIIKKDNNNSINEESNIKNKNDNNVKADKSNENKIENYSNIEDLINYINGSDNKKKRKKKKKKKAKNAKLKINEEEKENVFIEKDDVYENFKSNIINFTDNLEKVKKIKPKISEAFLEQLKSMN